ncbi:ECF RNA polymerase sigma factor SigK [Kocuria tytonis]|uniref:Sigma-70 family RNA polymerase sigma factor n=1 Tax=Kocuria tytonis TaxID=2054280 RepID=A0A495A6M7_9MICC|nr:ECF RNA polymerase sigma factor SigK [Kocuria tytonis]RKQ35205.1 sigma-70 family RNA polymerase sigma factor [Kocuria tytonis]
MRNFDSDGGDAGTSRSPRHRSHDGAAPRADPTAQQEDHLTALMARSAAGDETAFADLYDATAATVYGLVRRVVRSPELAAEVAQEVYLMAWQQAPHFDPSRGSVPGWLCTLAHRRAVDRVRQVTRERNREDAYENRRTSSAVDETWHEVERGLDEGAVRQGLGALSSLQREAVVLAYYGGYTYQDVARRLNVPLGTAKARIRDGLKKLGSALGVRA